MVRYYFSNFGYLADIPLTFLLTLLIMSMAIQVMYACHCEEVDWERVMCPGENKTVIMAFAIVAGTHVSSASGSSSTKVQTMMVEKIFKEGPFNLAVLTDRAIIMLTPQDCSFDPNLNDTMYIIYGTTDAGGILHSSNCTIAPYEGFFEKSGRENFPDIYWGTQDAKC
ncbi:hypothetical protein ACJMK2_004413 [Sinanodonta woodiana]|uniref:Uncharacterized protein n=1 Tax=Sinanodonta woodiana TaxID=1069815 RepID=A0ABD3Y152_SINWO